MDKDIEKNFQQIIPELQSIGNKFCPGILKWQKKRHIDLANTDDICKVRLLLNVLTKTPAYDFFDEEFNGLSPEMVFNTLGFIPKPTRIKKEKKFDYKIIPINSYEDAKSIAGDELWCILISEEAFNEYTKDGNRFYFLANKKWKEVHCNPGIDFPYDKYGYSLIAVEMSPENKIVSVTSRWNTCSNNSNYFLSPEELKEILGTKFKDLFV